MNRYPWAHDAEPEREVYEVKPKEMRVSPDGVRISSRALLSYIHAGICPPGVMGPRSRLFTRTEHFVFWARLAALGKPRRTSDRERLTRGRTWANAVQRQRKALRAFIDRVPTDAAEVVMAAATRALREHGLDLQPLNPSGK